MPDVTADHQHAHPTPAAPCGRDPLTRRRRFNLVLAGLRTGDAVTLCAHSAGLHHGLDQGRRCTARRRQGRGRRRHGVRPATPAGDVNFQISKEYRLLVVAWRWTRNDRAAPAARARLAISVGAALGRHQRQHRVGGVAVGLVIEIDPSVSCSNMPRGENPPRRMCGACGLPSGSGTPARLDGVEREGRRSCGRRAQRPKPLKRAFRQRGADYPGGSGESGPARRVLPDFPAWRRDRRAVAVETPGRRRGCRSPDTSGVTRLLQNASFQA